MQDELADDSAAESDDDSDPIEKNYLAYPYYANMFGCCGSGYEKKAEEPRAMWQASAAVPSK